MAEKVIVAPLNWGLGHATRCIPLIRALVQLGVEPVLASDGRSLLLLQNEFPEWPAAELPAYGIRYGPGGMAWNMIRQLPKIGRAVWREHRRIRRLARYFNARAIISDHRFGCFHPDLFSVVIAHQLNIQAASPALARPAGRLNRFFLGRFEACWIPDYPGTDNLSGALSHPSPLPSRTRYIGPLSRFDALEEEKRYDIVAVLSGPEPQRTLLERQLRRQLRRFPGRSLMALGKPEAGPLREQTGNLEIAGFLPANELNRAMAATRLVVCRSGYSTLMDLAAIGGKALLVPTPGQTEQEYLAGLMQERGWCCARPQADLCLERDIPQAMLFPGLPRRRGMELTTFLKQWLEKLPGFTSC